MTGFVYAMSAANGLVKIGYSEKPRLRLSKINSDAGSPCELVGFVAATRAQEKDLHTLLAPERSYGEWYRRERLVAHFMSQLPASSRPENASGRRLKISANHPLQEYRRAVGMSLQILSVTAQSDRSTLSRIERGLRSPCPNLALKLEAATRGAVPRWKLRPDLWSEPVAERLQ